jgi:Leucine-rich repeat (LRR) protein
MICISSKKSFLYPLSIFLFLNLFPAQDAYSKELSTSKTFHKLSEKEAKEKLVKELGWNMKAQGSPTKEDNWLWKNLYLRVATGYKHAEDVLMKNIDRIKKTQDPQGDSRLITNDDGITFIPPVFFKQGPGKDLEILNIESDKITYIPESLGHLKNLKILRLYTPALQQLPQSLGDLKNLQLIRLDSLGKVKKLPSSFKNLRSLKKIILLSTPLKKLPGDFNDYPNLEYLTLIDTQLATLPQGIENLKHLKSIAVVHTPLKRVPQGLLLALGRAPEGLQYMFDPIFLKKLVKDPNYHLAQKKLDLAVKVEAKEHIFNKFAQ